ncbi:MAG: lysophospholipid acyltransferase family protein [Gemmatimonadaceae bacterium]|nr:lysophospholipid acyltransferase family protein [Gemmatimonadaceae bacterium]
MHRPPAGRRGGTVNVPIVSDNVAQRGNWFLRWLMIGLMRLSGWRFTGADFPDARKFVLIVAPHTSNWDFIVGIRAMYALGIRGTFLGKDTLFRFPLGILMRFLGGFPVDRSKKSDVVTQTAELAQRLDKAIIVLSPEGTRSRVDRWRSGFYWIAVQAGIPILPVAFDFSTKAVHLHPLFTPTGDADTDLAYLRSLFRSTMAYDPTKYVE